MQSRIKIVKRNERDNSNNVPAQETAKTDHQRGRDTATTVKSWIAEWEERNRVVQAAALSLLRSFENSSESPTQRLAVVKG